MFRIWAIVGQAVAIKLKMTLLVSVCEYDNFGGESMVLQISKVVFKNI